MTEFKIIARGGIALFALSISELAYAQDELPQSPDGTSAVEATATVEQESAGNMIVVTARRRDESLQDVPLTVNAVTADAIEDLNLRRLEDITAVVPGLTLSTVKTSAGSTTTLRGVNYNSGVSGNNGTVEYYYNDGWVNSGAATIALFDIGQIEVLRGPQGTLRGRASPSGSINITARRPDLYDAGAEFIGTANDLGGHNFNGAINVPILEGKLGVRVAGLTAEDESDRIHALNETTEPKSRSRGIRASVRADPFDDLLLLDFMFQNVTRDQVNYDQVESLSEVIPGVSLSPVTIRARDRLSTSGLPATQSINYDLYNGQARLNLFGQSLVYVYSQVKGAFQQDEPLDKADIFANDRAPDGTPFYNTTQSLTNNKAHEIRLQNQERVAGIFDYVLGGFQLESTTNTPILRANAVGVLQPTPSITSITLSNQFRDSFSRERSIFGNLTVHLGEDTEISGGLRRIDYEITSGLAVNGVDVPSLRQIDESKKTIYSGSIKHDFTPDLMAYAAIGTSWRPGNVLIGGPTAPSPLQQRFLTIEEETSTNYEAGFKSHWFDRRLRLNVTAFYQKFKNYPYRAPSPIFAFDAARNAVVGFQYGASVPVTVKGVEAEFSADPLRNWNISGTVAYADGKVKDGVIPCLDLNGDGIPDVVTSAPSRDQLLAAVGDDFIGTCLLNDRANVTPEWTGTLTSEYWRPVSATSEAYLRGLLSWFGPTENDPVNPYDSIDSHALLNLYLGLRDADGAWDVSLYGKNITNTFRVLNRSNGPRATVISGAAGTQSYTNYFTINTTPEREFGVNLRVKFGGTR